MRTIAQNLPRREAETFTRDLQSHYRRMNVVMEPNPFSETVWNVGLLQDSPAEYLHTATDFYLGWLAGVTFARCHDA